MTATAFTVDASSEIFSDATPIPIVRLATKDAKGNTVTAATLTTERDARAVPALPLTAFLIP